MGSVLVRARVSPDDLLDAADQLGLTEFEEFVSNLLALRARRQTHALPREEAELLVKINRGLLPHVRARYDELAAKREAEGLTPQEHEELLQIVDQVEALEAERAEHLTKLARLRAVSLRALMDSLGIGPTNHG
jgi:hypothetical protein